MIKTNLKSNMHSKWHAEAEYSWIILKGKGNSSAKRHFRMSTSMPRMAVSDSIEVGLTFRTVLNPLGIGKGVPVMSKKSLVEVNPSL